MTKCTLSVKMHQTQEVVIYPYNENSSPLYARRSPYPPMVSVPRKFYCSCSKKRPETVYSGIHMHAVSPAVYPETHGYLEAEAGGHLLRRDKRSPPRTLFTCLEVSTVLFVTIYEAGVDGLMHAMRCAKVIRSAGALSPQRLRRGRRTPIRLLSPNRTRRNSAARYTVRRSLCACDIILARNEKYAEERSQV